MIGRKLLLALLLGTLAMPQTAECRAREGRPGSLRVSAKAAMGGSRLGLEVFAGKKAWVQSNHPKNERALLIRFLFDPHTLELPPGKQIDLLRLYSTGKSHHVKLVLEQVKRKRFAIRAFARGSDSRYALVGRGSARRKRETLIELIWQAADADGAPNGVVALVINGKLAAEQLTLDNAGLAVDKIRLGYMQAKDRAITGSYYLDEYASWW